MDCATCTYPVARTEHRCFLCGEPIEKGTKHRKLTGKQDGDWHTTRYHAECDAVTEIDNWDFMDWEVTGEAESEFRERRDELRASGEIERHLAAKAERTPEHE